jgi:hypothetical protein
MPRNLRLIFAVLATIPLALIVIFFGLVAGLSLLQEVLMFFIDLGETSWTAFLNPSVLLGLQSPGGTGGIFDALVGGPGAPGGTVSRYIVFMLAAGITFIAFFALTAIWSWTKESEK